MKEPMSADAENNLRQTLDKNEFEGCEWLLEQTTWCLDEIHYLRTQLRKYQSAAANALAKYWPAQGVEGDPED